MAKRIDIFLYKAKQVIFIRGIVFIAAINEIIILLLYLN